MILWGMGVTTVLVAVSIPLCQWFHALFPVLRLESGDGRPLRDRYLGVEVNVACVVALLLHATTNVLDHANLQLSRRLAWLSNHWASRHDAHHTQVRVNYGSITPLWDT